MKYVNVENGFSTDRVVTREEIQKTIFEGMSHIKKRYGDQCTIKDLIKEIEKIEKRSTFGLGIPFYCLYPIILGEAMKKKKELLKDIIKMYEYAYHCNFEFIGFDNKYKPRFAQLGEDYLTLEEIMDKTIDLNKLLDSNFVVEYGNHLFGELNFGKRHTVEEYLDYEKKAKEIEDKAQQQKNTKKAGRK